MYKSITNVKFNQLMVFILKIRGMDRHVTEIIVVVNKIHANMAYLHYVYMSDYTNSLR